MSQAAVHDWLPPEVVLRPAVRARIEEAVAEWSSAWFATRAIGVSGVKTVARFKAGEDRRLEGKTARVGYSDRAARRLLDWALDARLDQATLTPLDQKILDGFERKLVEDLLVRLDAILAVSPAGAARESAGGLEVGLCEAQSGDLLTLSLPQEAVLPLARAALPAPRPRDPLDNLAGALAGTDVVIDITLGEADVRLGDLHALAPGDVLILGTPLTGLAQVTLAGSPEVFARAALTDLDGQMAVTFQA